MDNEHRFTIEDGVLTAYSGPGGSVVIPEGVTAIGGSAFSNSRGLTEVTVPAGVKSIGSWAFRRCRDLVRVSLPDGLTEIGAMAFYRCERLESLVVPATVTAVGDHAFADCKGLRFILFLNPAPKLGRSLFGAARPECLVENALDLYGILDDDQLCRYILTKKVWPRLEPDDREEIFLARQGDALAEAYRNVVTPEDADAFADTLLLRGQTLPRPEDGPRIMAFLMTVLCDRLTPRRLLQLYSCLEAREDALPCLDDVKRSAGVAEKIGSLVFHRLEAERMTLLAMQEAGLSAQALEKRLKQFYALTLEDLPVLSDRGENRTAPFVLAWLLTADENYVAGNPAAEMIRPGHAMPGPGPEAAEIASMLSPASVQQALLALAERFIHEEYLTKRLFLAWPVCRFADEETMAEVIRRTEERYGSLADSDLPFPQIFREACLYSRTRCAMALARRTGDWDRYLALRISERSHPKAFTVDRGVLKAYLGPGGEVVIPDGVTAVGDRAFDAVRGFRESLEFVIALDRGEKDPPESIRLTGVMIPDSVSAIGDSAFAHCAWLRSVTVPEGVRSIGDSAFRGCRRLSLVTLPENASTGEHTFSGCPDDLEFRRI